MNILMSGSTGLVGKALSKELTNDGHEISPLVRHKVEATSGQIEWRPNRGIINPEDLEGFDAVIHLAGESIASGRWNAEKKRRILESRQKGTMLLTNALAKLGRPPAVFISASAIGYYGNRGNELLNEESGPGQDFLAKVCFEWEQATAAAKEKGIRTLNARIGIVLAQQGGALAKMLTPFRMGFGGKIGEGKQWMSWVALDDVIGAFKFLLINESLLGPVNIVGPNPVTNAEFTKILGKALSRPTLFPVPAFLARTAFGEMADALLLSSARVDPQKLRESGYSFRFPKLAEALAHVLR